MSALASLLFTDYRRRVLGLLLQRPEGACHVREITRLTGTVPGTPNKERLGACPRIVFVAREVHWPMVGRLPAGCRETNNIMGWSEMSEQFNVDSQNPADDAKPLPFVAPCRDLDLDAPIRWVRLGIADLKRAPAKSLAYGLVATLLSYVAGYLGFVISGPLVLLTILSGLILIGPVMAIGLYSISCQLKIGLVPKFSYCFRDGTRGVGNLALFSSVLIILFLVWIHVGHLLHLFFPAGGLSGNRMDLIFFFGIGFVVGAVFAVITFCISAFSLPMVMDRKTDLVTAVVTSINAVLRNRKVMLLWAAIILGGLVFSVITGLLALVVIFPVIGHATWHAYQETVDASDWPQRT
jgi:uncharacterized membrane protein